MDNTRDTSHIKRAVKVFGGLLVVGLIFLGGVYVGYENRPSMQKIIGLAHKESPETISADFAPFWKAWSIMNEKFADADKTSSQERVYGAIQGLLASFNDPYTTFFPPAENTVFESQILGEFNGVGVEIGQKEGILTVIAPLKDTPADIAGIKSGDKIVKINDAMTNDMTIDEAITLIRGEEGTTVSLTIFREGFTEPKVFTMKRQKINLPTVDTETRAEQKTFIIHLYNFSAQSPELFRQALTKYINSGYPNLVLDMRGNPGGYLEAASTIGGFFIPEGKAIVKEIRKTPEDIKVHTSKGPVLFPSSSKLIVLVDKGSASAAEILAGALSEHGIGTLVGEQTFGKGSVQEVVPVTADTSMKVTVAKWYTPHGISISEKGLIPTIVIPYTSESKGVDAQLNAAIKLFPTL